MKHNTKKKLSMNMASKKKTGAGPYEEQKLTSAEELIIEAAGLTAAVEGLSSVEIFGSHSVHEKESMHNLENDDGSQDNNEVEEEDEDGPQMSTKTRRQKRETKMTLLKENISKLEEWQTVICCKLDKLIDLKERYLKSIEAKNAKLDKIISLKEKSLRLKEAELKANIATKEVDLKIKTLELEALQQNHN